MYIYKKRKIIILTRNRNAHSRKIVALAHVELSREFVAPWRRRRTTTNFWNTDDGPGHHGRQWKIWRNWEGTGELEKNNPWAETKDAVLKRQEKKKGKGDEKKTTEFNTRLLKWFIEGEKENWYTSETKRLPEKTQEPLSSACTELSRNSTVIDCLMTNDDWWRLAVRPKNLVRWGTEEKTRGRCDWPIVLLLRSQLDFWYLECRVNVLLECFSRRSIVFELIELIEFWNLNKNVKF